MTSQHAISKVNLTVNAPRSADGFALQNEISRWFWGNLSPELENILNQLASTEEVITIERLHIDISPITFTNWQRELTPSVCRAFEEALKQILYFPKASDTGVVRQSISQSQFDTWLIFLKTGSKRVLRMTDC